MNEKEFKTYWKENKEQLLNDSTEYRQAKESYKANSSTDWLLFGIPVVVGIVVMELCGIQKELLKWFVGAGATVASFVLCVWVKSIFSKNVSLDDIEKRIKQQQHNEKTGHD